MEFFKQFFKNPLHWNCRSDSEIISRECSLGDPFQNLFAKVWMGASCTIRHDEILKKSFSLKPLVRFWNNFKGMFLKRPFSKKCLRNFDPSINMALVNGGFLHSMDMKKFLKNLPRNRWSDFEIISQKCSLSDLSQKLLAKFWSVIKHGSSEWGLISLSGHEQILKKSFSLKALVRFWDNFMEMFLGWPFSKIVCEILICQ